MVEESEVQLENLKEDITENLESFEKEFQQHFPELTDEETGLEQIPFSASLNVANEFLDLQSDFSAHILFQEKLLLNF